MMCANVLINASFILLLNYPHFIARNKTGVIVNSTGYIYCEPNSKATEYAGYVYSIHEGYLYVFCMQNMSFFERSPTESTLVEKSYDDNFLIFGLENSSFIFASAVKNYLIPQEANYEMSGGYFLRIDSFFNLEILNFSKTAVCQRDISLQEYRQFFSSRQEDDIQFEASGVYVIIKALGSLRVNVRTGEVKSVAISAEHKPYAFGNQLFFFNVVDYRSIGGVIDSPGYGPPPSMICTRRYMRRFKVCSFTVVVLLVFAFLLEKL